MSLCVIHFAFFLLKKELHWKFHWLIVQFKSLCAAQLQVEGIVDPEIARREKARLNEMHRLKKQKIQEMLDAQNAAIDADMVRL